jgi:hypothetical protein
MAHLFFIFAMLFVLLLGGLSIADFVQGSTKEGTFGQQYFALIYLLMALGLGIAALV